MTGAAGEHYVAYCLSSLGYPTALTRGGSPTVDIIVGDLSGHKSVMIQVKTSNWAWRERKRKPQESVWQWDVGAKAKTLKGKNIFYCFVDLRSGNNLEAKPCVYVVPSIDVANRMGPDWSRYMFWITLDEEKKYIENWSLITDALSNDISIAPIVAMAGEVPQTIIPPLSTNE